jgi:hypothetical protein
MHEEQAGAVVIIAIIMIILFAIVYDPSSITYVIVAICMLLYMATIKKPVEEKVDVIVDEPAVQQIPKEENASDTNDDAMTDMSDANRFALDQVYGRKGNNIDNKMTEHRQRIGDRDRQATIAQIKGRRQNVYEPYYRQELSEHGSKKWWEPDDVLVSKLQDNQMATIQTGRHAVV